MIHEHPPPPLLLVLLPVTICLISHSPVSIYCFISLPAPFSYTLSLSSTSFGSGCKRCYSLLRHT